MHQDGDEWFDGDSRNEREKVFLRVLRDQASLWESLGVRPDHTGAYSTGSYMVAYVDVDDSERGVVVGTLQVELHDTVTRAGWGDSQLVRPLETTDPDFVEGSLEGAVEHWAQWAVKWLRGQLARPVYRHEWIGFGRTYHGCWVLADTGRRLCGWDPDNCKRTISDPPNRIVHVRGALG